MRRLNLVYRNFNLLESLNSGCQTVEKIFTDEFVSQLGDEVTKYMIKYDKIKQDFQVRID